VLQVKGIPFLAFDAGGVLEMFNGKIHKDNVVLEPTLAALTAKLTEVSSFALSADEQPDILVSVAPQYGRLSRLSSPSSKWAGGIS